MSKFKPRSLYAIIIDGYCESEFRAQPIYFIHFNNRILGRIESFEEEIYNRAQSDGLLTEKQSLERLIKDDIWSEQKELELRQEKEFLEARLTTKKNLFLESQIKNINIEIQECEDRIYKIISERNKLLGFTVENYVRCKINEINIKLASFKDKDLKESYFNDETFNELEDFELEELIIKYNEKFDYINNNLKKLAISTFMQNQFHLCKEAGLFHLYGKPIVDLTLFQIDLFVFSNFFANILSGENPPSEEMLNDPDKIVENHQKNSKMKDAMGERKGDLTGGSVIGAKKSDYKAAAIQGNFVNFRSKLKEGSSELSAVELANIFNKNT